jgi:tRNA nucleotidyltransferase (CCA-adding enzyme)
MQLTKAARGASILNRTVASYTVWKPSQWTLYLDELPSLAVYAVWLVTYEPALRQYFTAWRNIKPYTTGYTLQGRGLAPGPRYKEILSRLRAAWLDGELKSEEEEIDLLSRLTQ